MTDYYKLNAELMLANNSSYWQPLKHTITEWSGSNASALYTIKQRYDTSGEIYKASRFTSIAMVIIQNLSATTDTTLGYTDAGATARQIVIGFGEILVFSDVSPTVAMTLSANVSCDVTIIGA